MQKEVSATASKSRRKAPNGRREEYRKMETVWALSAFILIINLLIFAAKSEGSAKPYLIAAGAVLYLGLSLIMEKSNRNHDWWYIIPMSALAIMPFPLIKIFKGYYSFAWVFAAELIIFGLIVFALLKGSKNKKK